MQQLHRPPPTRSDRRQATSLRERPATTLVPLNGKEKVWAGHGAELAGTLVACWRLAATVSSTKKEGPDIAGHLLRRS